MLCELCRRQPATGVRSTVTRSSDGAETRTTEQLCRACAAASHGDAERRAAEARASVADGSYFEQIRAEVAALEVAGDVGALARAAEFFDLLVAKLDAPVPADLRAFADRHRRPVA